MRNDPPLQREKVLPPRHWWRLRHVIVGALLCSCMAACLQSASPAAAQTTPFSLLPADTLAAFAYTGGDPSNREVVDVAGQSFARALRLRTPSPSTGSSTSEYQYRIRANISVPVSAGDTVLATFWARCVEPDGGYAFARLNVERNAAPYTKSVARTVAINRTWQRFQIPFTMAESYAPGVAQVQFWLGYDLQQIEIGGICVVDYGRNVAVADLPIDPPYQGRESDAPWRAAAAERIDRYRKADLTVVVQDPDGNPVPDATVAVRMKRHAFGFGSAVAAQGLLGTGPNDPIYRDTVRLLFNKVVFENDLKWPNWASNPQRALDALQWLWDSGITDVRGHTLVWPNWSRMPGNVKTTYDAVKATNGEAAAAAWLRDRINTHIVEEAGALQGRIVDWDVVNEPYTNHDVLDILGQEEMAQWFLLAREADPNAKLFLNDFNILEGGGANYWQQRYNYNTIRYLESLGAPIDGFGMQSHFGANLTPPETVLAILDRFAGLGKALQITEFDIDTTDEELQADYTRDFLTTVFSHPAVDSFLMWGFWAGRHWKPNGAMYRADWTIKPNGQVYNDLVFKEWWTDVQGATDEQGTYQPRAFLGDYEIEVSALGQTQTVQTTLVPGGRTVIVTVEMPAGPDGA